MTGPAQSNSPVPSTGGDPTCRVPVETAAGGLTAPAATPAPAGWRAGLEALLGRFLPRLAGAFGFRPFWRGPEACPERVRPRTEHITRIVPLPQDVPLDPKLVAILRGRSTAVFTRSVGAAVPLPGTTRIPPLPIAPAGARQGLPRVIATDEAAS